jgi:hypothetical protein
MSHEQKKFQKHDKSYGAKRPRTRHPTIQVPEDNRGLVTVVVPVRVMKDVRSTVVVGSGSLVLPIY